MLKRFVGTFQQRADNFSPLNFFAVMAVAESALRYVQHCNFVT
jgi:hypothetical protein